jgi:hypothetical protein
VGWKNLPLPSVRFRAHLRVVAQCHRLRQRHENASEV